MAQLELRIADDDLAPADRAELARNLLDLLQDADLEAELGRDAAVPPSDARAGEALEAGLVLVQVAAEMGAFQFLFGLIQGWLGRTEAGDVEMNVGDRTLKVSRATPDQQQQLIDHFIAVTGDDD